MMPSYCFLITEGLAGEDLIEYELLNDKMAHQEAVRLLGEMMRDHPDRLGIEAEWRVDVSRVNGPPMFTVRTSMVDRSPSGGRRSGGQPAKHP